MSIVNLSFSEESLGKGSQGYDDGASSSTTLGYNSSIFGSTERDKGPVKSAASVDENKVTRCMALNFIFGGVEIEAINEGNVVAQDADDDDRVGGNNVRLGITIKHSFILFSSGHSALS
ncbi:hypothetical protein LR48_Vigan02g081300 [Vigna angularis]|uniref:Uncharacterized protein n=1 Tax=Phaseolus angularis TaxID=3914 RepID=A0A0L9TVN9_PHAAN|nr:hypothetical protein LR48_Vigan02g081300 [Vigna angularis]